MTFRRLRRLLAYPIAASLAAALLGSSAGVLPAAAATYPTDTNMILHNVPPEDLRANSRGICDGDFNIVVRNVGSAAGAINYLDAAQACGLKAVLFLSTTTTAAGKVYPTRAGAFARAVRGHPALYGYLSVKEPGGTRVSAAEIRALYKAYKKFDKNHPVVGLFGDIPHFGGKTNPYTAGMADIVMVNWYPVETARRGCSASGTSYIPNGPKWFRTKVYPTVKAMTPNAPIWVMVQTHKYTAPACHKKQRPTVALLNRQVREALGYARATGIAFHVFKNVNYRIDQSRDQPMVNAMKTISRQVRAGTFQ